MKSHIILAGVLLLLPFSGRAQRNTTEQWSPVMKGRANPIFIAKDDSSIYFVRIKPNFHQDPVRSYKCSIIRIHNDLTHAVESHFKIPKHFLYQFYAAIGKNILVFSSFKDTTHHETILYAQAMNKKTLSLEPPFKVVSLEGAPNTAIFKIHYCPDSSQFLISAATNKWFHLRLNIVPPPDRIQFWVMDQQLKIISSNTRPIYFLKQGQVFNEHELALDNDGTVYMVGRVYESLKELYRGSISVLPYNNLSGRPYLRQPGYYAVYKYYVCIYPKEGKSTVLPVDIDGFARSLRLFVSKKQIYLAGIYTNDLKLHSTGCFVIKLKKNSDAFAFKTFYPYWDLITRDQSQDEVGATQYSLPKVRAWTREDSTVILTLNLNMREFGRMIRHTDEVAMIRLSPDGHLMDEEIVLKQPSRVIELDERLVSRWRYYTEENYSFVADFRYNNDLAFVYNRNKNELMMTTIANNGAITTRSLVAKTALKPLPMRTAYKSGLLITRRRNRTFQIGRVRINEDSK